MARDADDREDLLADATALVERIELKLPYGVDNIIVGFRREGAASFYFGPEPVYQFNAQRQLRRAYQDGKLIKADRGQLAALTPLRLEGRTELRRHDLSPEESAALLSAAKLKLNGLLKAIDEGAAEIVGQVPEGIDLLARVRSWLGEMREAIEIASTPRA